MVFLEKYSEVLEEMLFAMSGFQRGKKLLHPSAKCEATGQGAVSLVYICVGSLEMRKQLAWLRPQIFTYQHL